MIRSLAVAPNLLLFLSLMSAPALATVPPSHVQCADRKSFKLVRTEGGAIVTLGKRRIHMDRKPSSIGPSYSSAEGSLIIDRDYIAFVLEDDLAYRNCRLLAADEK